MKGLRFIFILKSALKRYIEGLKSRSNADWKVMIIQEVDNELVTDKVKLFFIVSLGLNTWEASSWILYDLVLNFVLNDISINDM